MKIVKSVTKNGVKRVTVDVQPGEQLVAVEPSQHYRLGYPLDDQVIHANHIQDAVLVTWCSAEQKWIS